MAKKQENLVGIGGVRGIIQNLQTTEIFETEFSSTSLQDLSEATVRNGWSYNWLDFADAFKICKVSTVNNPEIVQGLVAFTVEKDHVFMDFVENAPFNRGNSKLYGAVAGNLIAFLCYLSQKLGYNGYVFFKSKPQLTDYYTEHYDAEIHPKYKDLLYFNPKNAKFLISRYLNF
jgi:predicted dithiol-disulfide oxidoreductase (DUF899 family)